MINILDRHIKDPENQAIVDYYKGQVQLNEGKLAAARHLMEQLVISKDTSAQLKLSI